ncbi:hypothetical protein [Teichococcus wenyumeiae]|uniref:hypothetical protein n=1 Tax=Teichococcus wenyumeiae TaxID=2478470 RepID=UPI001315855A|nr:hypothetical protein [Pseudoroseomonas wenyumeiae]
MKLLPCESLGQGAFSLRSRHDLHVYIKTVTRLQSVAVIRTQLAERLLAACFEAAEGRTVA